MISRIPEFQRKQITIQKIRNLGQFNLQLNMEQADNTTEKGKGTGKIFADEQKSGSKVYVTRN